MDIKDKNTEEKAVVSSKFNPADYAGYEIVRPYDEIQITERAATNGGRRILKEIAIKTADKYCFVYLVRKPSRNHLKAIASKKKGDKPDEDAIEKLMMGLVLEGDKETIENDGAVYSALMLKLGGLVRGADGDIKEA